MLYCCFFVLSCSCIVMLMYCCIFVLLCWCIVMLLCCCVVVLFCCCVVVLLCCCVVVLLYCGVVVLFIFKRLVVCCIYDSMPQQSHHHQQYDKICISYSFKDPTKKGLNASEKLQHVPEERSQRKKLGHKIINVTYPDNTPFGWAFDNFYDAKILSSIYPTGMAKSPYLVA
jgi:hypothetical protein